jgi:type IV secretory pathway TrbL component
MRVTIICSLTAAALLALAGCNKAESPGKVDSDVASAANSAAEKDVKANESEAKTEASADQDVAKAQEKADAKTAAAAADTAVTQAEGDHKVAVEKCEALSGDAQKACKDQADATLDQAKAHAKAMKADRG